MALERLTDMSILAIHRGQEESRRLGCNFFGTEELLLGLLQTGDTTASQALTNLGVTLAGARTTVEEIVGRRSDEVLEEIPFTHTCKQTVEFAILAADELGDNSVEPSHLLLGIIEAAERRPPGAQPPVAIQVLLALQIEPSDVRTEILRLRQTE